MKEHIKTVSVNDTHVCFHHNNDKTQYCICTDISISLHIIRINTYLTHKGFMSFTVLLLDQYAHIDIVQLHAYWDL